MRPKLDPHQRAQVAALHRSATENTVAMTAPARSAFQQSFIDRAREGIGPFRDELAAQFPHLSEEALAAYVEPEVQRRAAALRKAHYARLSASGVSARQRKKKAGLHPTQDPPTGGGPR